MKSLSPFCLSTFQRNVISIRGKAMVKSGKESVLSADALKIAGTDRQKLEGLSAYFPTQKHVV